MRKFISILVVLLMMAVSYTGVMADAITKDAGVNLFASVEKVKVGETVTLSAEVVKNGSAIEDEWQGAVKTGIVLDEITGKYLSTAVFTAKEPGVFTVYYAIRMYAGSSDIEFAGTAVKTIEVTDSREVIGARVGNLIVQPFVRDDGSISGYSVTGTVYSVWNDGTEEPYSTLSLFFNQDETFRTVSVSIIVDGKQYVFPVTVSVQ